MTKDENKMHLHFDNGWWDFILSDEPVSYGENGQNRVRNFENDDNDWDYVEKIFHDDVIIEVIIDGVNKGGLLASAENLRGFIPISHILLEEKPRTNDEKIELLQSKVGNKTKVKIVECDASKNKVVLSERAAQTEDGKRKELISTLKPGLVVEGKVTNITDFGVFVDLGGVEGLVHISELSWGRVRSPSNYAELNQPISVQILSVDQRDMHVALSIKRLLPNPWFEIERKYKPGDVVAAQIVKILPYGAFACLEEGIEGLIHISTLKLDDKIRDLKHVFQIDQEVYVEILHIDSKKHRLGLAIAHFINKE